MSLTFGKSKGIVEPASQCAIVPPLERETHFPRYFVLDVIRLFIFGSEGDAMSIGAKTEHGEFRFRVSEFEKGAYVSTEPLGGLD